MFLAHKFCKSSQLGEGEGGGKRERGKGKGERGKGKGERGKGKGERGKKGKVD